MEIGIGIFSLLVVAYGLASGRLEGTSVTAPMVFVTVGLVVGATGELPLAALSAAHGSGPPSMELTSRALLTTAEVALALVLFTDAARLRVRSVQGNIKLPARLLFVGLPLSIALGGALAALLFKNQLVGWEALLLAAIVAPTDAALGEAVVTSSKLPIRVRQTLNVESGLNDGLAVPLFTIFLALAVAQEEANAVSAARVIAEKIGLGLAVGLALGLIGGRLVRLSVQHAWITGLFRQLTIAALGILTWWVAEEIGGSGFIAAFVGGLVAGRIFQEIGTSIIDFTEDTGQLLNLLIFFVFGVISFDLLDLVAWQTVVFAILALTLMRIVPVAMAVFGTALGRPTVWFVGWFGPRGLASIILAYIAVGEEPWLPGITTVAVATTVVVLMSVYAHGITAAPLVRRYAGWCSRLPTGAPELVAVPELPPRVGSVIRPAEG